MEQLQRDGPANARLGLGLGLLPAGYSPAISPPESRRWQGAGFCLAAHHPRRFKSLYSCVTFRNALSMADSNTSRFGFVAFAETWNGRLAMLGFVIGLGTELLTGQGILGQLGLG